MSNKEYIGTTSDRQGHIYNWYRENGRVYCIQVEGRMYSVPCLPVLLVLAVVVAIIIGLLLNGTL